MKSISLLPVIAVLTMSMVLTGCSSSTEGKAGSDTQTGQSSNDEVLPPENQLTAGKFLKMSLNLSKGVVANGRTDIKAEALIFPHNMNSSIKVSDPELPLNVCLVLDTSGSMEQDKKLASLLAATTSIAKALSETDFLSIVTYSTDGKLVLPSISKGKTEALLHVIDKIEAVGATNISHGLELASTEIEKERSEKFKNHIILLSDGKANFGIKDPGKLVELVTGISSKGISVSTIGFGTDYNKELLPAMASAGHGKFYDVKDSSAIFETLFKEIMIVKNAVIKNIVLTVESGEGVIINGFKPSNAVSCETSFEKGKAVFSMRGLGNKEEAGFIVSFQCPPTQSNTPIAFATFKARYVACKDGKESVEELDLTAMYTVDSSTGRERWFTGTAP